LLAGCGGRGAPRYRAEEIQMFKATVTSAHDGKAVAQKRYGKRQTTSAGSTQIERHRTLTVSAVYRQWGDEHRKNECAVSSIRLNGKWLAKLGILAGQKIRVITNGSIITLAPVAFDRELCRYAK
jgi:hypothetical protein